MKMLRAFVLASVLVTLVSPPSVSQERSSLAAGALLGTDFVSGAAAVDLAEYLQQFLHGRSGTDSPRTFELTSQWTAATFLVRDTDNRGMPLLGATAGGVVEGSLMSYRLGLVSPSASPLRVFAVADFFVASHLSNFVDLLTPSKVTPYGPFETLNGETLLNWVLPIGLINGGSRTGFSARAVQVLPGISFSPGRWLGVQAGVIFRYRDPINEDGRFISRFYVDDLLGDYADESLIPSGVEGEQRQELFFAAQVFGVQADLLLTAAGLPAYASLARELAMFLPERWGITAVIPRLTFLDDLAQNVRDDAVWNPSLEFAFIIPTEEYPLGVRTRLAWLHDPLAFQNAAVDLSWWIASVGVSVKDDPARGPVAGVRGGVSIRPQTVPGALSFDVSYNHLDGALGALDAPDRVLFNLGVSF